MCLLSIHYLTIILSFSHSNLSYNCLTQSNSLIVFWLDQVVQILSSLLSQLVTLPVTTWIAIYNKMSC